MSATTRFTLPLLSAAQAQKHVTHNESLEELDALVSATATGFTSAPLGTEVDGAAYIVQGGTGVFDGWDDSLVYLLGGVWVTIPPTDGMRVWLTNVRLLVVYQASIGGWEAITRAGVPFGSAVYVATTGSDANLGTIDTVASPASVTFTNSSSHVGWTAHGRAVGDVVTFISGGTLPTNFESYKAYYVKTVIDDDTIIVSNAAGGSAIVAGSAGSGPHFGFVVSACLTIRAALAQLYFWDCSGFPAAVYVADGDYPETVLVDRRPLDAYSLTIQGNITTPGNVTGVKFQILGDADVSIYGFETESISVSGHANVDLPSNMSWVGAGVHVTTRDQSSVDMTGIVETIAGSFIYHVFAVDQSKISYFPSDVTLVGPPTFTTFAQAFLGGLIDASFWRSGATVTGTGTGKKHDASANSTITTSGDDFPGTVTGTVSAESYYD